MMGGAVCGACVLSAVPLLEGRRDEICREFGPETVFLDLQRLRRLPVRKLFETVRAARVRTALVTGPPEELELFLDYLLLLAWFVPAANRKVKPFERATVSADSALLLLGTGVRIALSLLAGAGAVAATWGEALYGLVARWAPTQAAVIAKTCLYLKPGLNFGKPVGGSVTHVAGVVNALVRRSFDVTLLSSQPQAMIDPRIPQFVQTPDFGLALLHELNQHRYRPRFGARALAEARRIGPGFVYQRYALNDMSGALLRAKLRVPLVVEFNGSEVWVQKHWGRRLIFERAARAAERAALRAADLVVVVSEEVGRQARDLGVPAGRILSYPNGVDEREFDPARFDDRSRKEVFDRFHIPAESLLFTFVGTFGEWHGTDVLASAILSLREEDHPWLRESRAHFLFLGDGPLCAGVRERLRSHVDERVVTFGGLRPHAETSGILAASDVLVSPHKPNDDGSRFFGSPTKLFEYMAMARLIVASDLDQIGWVLRGWQPGAPPPDESRHVAGILVTPGSVADLIRGLKEAAAMSPEERGRRGQQARAIVLRAFTWDRNVDAVMAMLEGRVKRPGGRVDE